MEIEVVTTQRLFTTTRRIAAAWTKWDRILICISHIYSVTVPFRRSIAGGNERLLYRINVSPEYVLLYAEAVTASAFIEGQFGGRAEPT
ncbi:hypothetical protein DMN91_002120 [Ooceraea biroi]|uniref:Uncharacterized protein n=1 Tax=Ooceraea biroi TaxID=2015173 RepID=A0A3L8DZX3_OOCBI|nr:hypothetical protein DMN91_002120 [Ooceraea biroi]